MVARAVGQGYQLKALIAALLAITVEAGAQSTGTVRGHVRSKTGDAVVGATVLVVGTRIGGLADSTGLYVIGRVPIGAVTVRARSIGYADTDQTVEVRADAATTADFILTESVTTLGTVRTEGKPIEREVFDSKPNLGVTVISGKVASGVPRLGEADGRQVARPPRQRAVSSRPARPQLPAPRVSRRLPSAPDRRDRLPGVAHHARPPRR